MKKLEFMGAATYLAFLLSGSSIADDGFYQGSGNDLVPVQNSNMRVISERLDLLPLKKDRCFPVVQPKSAFDDGGAPLDGAVLELGKEHPCAKEWKPADLRVRWAAKAIYEIEALDDQPSVQIGFPVPYWTFDNTNKDGLINQRVPAVVDFETWVGDRRMENLSVKEVPVPNRFKPESGNQNQTAYVWKADFKKGGRYRLTTTYSFGSDMSNGFYDTREMPKGKMLWFDQRTPSDAAFTFYATDFSAKAVLFFLHPLKLWNPTPPEQVFVRVAAPPGLDVTYLVPSAGQVKCVDTKAIYYDWRNEFPPIDLNISYPDGYHGALKNPYPKMSRDSQLFAWIDLLLAEKERLNPSYRNLKLPISLSCDLVERLKRDLGKKSYIYHWIKEKNLDCVQSCEAFDSTAQISK